MFILSADTLSVFIVMPAKTQCIVEYLGLQGIKGSNGFLMGCP
jgi:hypothetical protein